MQLNSKFHLIIPASGIGSRFNSNTPKQYALMTNGKTILDNTIKIFIDNGNFEKFIIVLNKKDNFFKTSEFFNHPKITIVLGSSKRFLSVKNGVSYLFNTADKDDFIAVHDSVRPCVTNNDINNLLVKIDNHKVGGLLVTPAFDTLKSYKNNKLTTLDRSNIYHALTPQIYRLGLLKDSLDHVIKNNLTITDDASSIEILGKKSLIVEGSKHNIKITTKSDLTLANLIFDNF